MNNIGFGIFCFGEEYYYKGTVEKINSILDKGFHCYILTEDTEFFTKKYTSPYLHVFGYNRSYKSYADKMILPKHVLKNHDICILIDADTHITDYTFLDDLRHFSFREGISYIDTLLNHNANREFVKDLINKDANEWKSYVEYVTKLCPDYGEFNTMWEYFLVINKNGFNLNYFYYYYERLQIVKEFSDLSLNKLVSGAGEGISIQVSGKLSGTSVTRDMELYRLIKDKMVSVSRRFVRPEFWPDWMK
jgi:hypothetical protein